MHQIQKDLLALSRNINLGEKSLREIGRLINVEHPQKISHHLQQLQKKGFLRIDKSRSLVKNVNKNSRLERSFINIPIVGAANCGPAQLLAEENIEGHLKVSKSIVRGKTLFAVKASGDSMNRSHIDGEAIQNGDYVIVDRGKTALNHGDYGLFVVDGAANIKRPYVDRSNHRIALISESTYDYPPIYIDESDEDTFIVNGKVIKVIGRPKF
ncbi:hypothetical protein KC622_02015 [Candidatus Dojkabacteria bacterium]|uniref:Peptidase S24/S26A/S26B/S26C domain-containing protein n=1 Tax=Candidatus Dojkabacteria bacterium TaxID=2099670 RepID=A0A955HZN9_9BACT|nr:hypothetical protein [Candidatus Dojkabacteria bacterium]